MLAKEKYKKSEASIERAGRIAGVSVSKMMDILLEHNVEMNLQHEDYLKGLDSLRKTWLGFVCEDFYQVKMEIDFPLCLQLRKNSIRKTAGEINGTVVGIFRLCFRK